MESEDAVNSSDEMENSDSQKIDSKGQSKNEDSEDEKDKDKLSGELDVASDEKSHRVKKMMTIHLIKSKARQYLTGLYRSQSSHKSKKFVKIKAVSRGYFVDLLKLLGGLNSTHILSVL
ncbi:hypothetical protein Trydic_g3556 [Trypoxylus dichotomus]